MNGWPTGWKKKRKNGKKLRNNKQIWEQKWEKKKDRSMESNTTHIAHTHLAFGIFRSGSGRCIGDIKKNVCWVSERGRARESVYLFQIKWNLFQIFTVCIWHTTQQCVVHVQTKSSIICRFGFHCNFIWLFCMLIVIRARLSLLSKFPHFIQFNWKNVCEHEGEGGHDQHVCDQEKQNIELNLQ